MFVRFHIAVPILGGLFVAKIPMTQRAYTLRLRGANPDDTAWRDALWATHEAVNKGAKVFGDWLLTLRGGLDHRLADEKVSQEKGKPERDPTDEERRDRRILLALSWLSVESAPKDNDPYKAFVIASGKNDCQSKRNEKVICVLRQILEKRGVHGTELDNWIKDCEPSLSAAIRDDAVWVNRSAAFDVAAKKCPSLTRDEIWDFLEPFFGGRMAYLAPLKSEEATEDAPPTEDKAKALVKKAGQWLSSRFGTGKGADFDAMSKVYDEIAKWALEKQTFSTGAEALVSLVAKLKPKGFHPPTTDANGILDLISGPGYQSATRNRITAWQSQSTQVTAENLAELCTAAKEDAAKCTTNTGRKGRRNWSDAILRDVENACGFTYRVDKNGKDVSIADYSQYKNDYKWGSARHSEFAVMLDHAARRVSIGHSWIKRAEAERQRFQTDAEKISNVPADTKAWLDQFCEQRSGITGAIDAYRIRKRAVEGWKEVITRWNRTSCKTVEDRVAAARKAQTDPDIDKFGDIQLFEALAEDDAQCVWRVNDEVSPQPLIDYVTATDAEAKQRRFKVPAYRHPDPLAHPVFCDFGNSRWEIRFAAHAAASKLDDARRTLARRETELGKSQKQLAKANTPEKQTKAQAHYEQSKKNLAETKEDLVWLSSRHAISMGLWNGHTLDNCLPLRWLCKRLTKDMALRLDVKNPEVVAVTRADRLGRAAAGALAESSVSIHNVFNEKHWNGRLQAPRAQLDALAKHVARYGWNTKAEQMCNRIRWLVSFSAKLQPAGPWIDYAATYSDGAPAKPFVSRKGEYALNHLSNDSRQGHAKLVLSRLPGLRVLSVDLGHRHAAACAVWEALTGKQMKDACQAANNHRLPTESDLYLHLKTADARTTIYRRVGADTLPDGQPHPAPWARLDRQFLIKLPGEELPPRAASKTGDTNEIQQVADFAKRLGLFTDDERENGRAVDKLMSRTMRIATLGLKRHGSRAKIAYALDPNTKAIPGMGGSEKPFTPGDEDHVKFLTDALFDDWYVLATDSKWEDKPARELWNQHIATMTNGWRIEKPPPDTQTTDEPTHQQRRKNDDDLRQRLQPIAAQFAKADRTIMHKAWKNRWENDDGKNAVVPDAPKEDQKGPPRTDVLEQAAGWYADLRWLTDWIMGKYMPGATNQGWKQNVGGLSITRIATMKSLYWLHKAFAMRAKPDKPRGAPEKGEINAGVAQSIRTAMERMREQRVKQIASRIAEAALGIGIERRSVNGRDLARPRERIDNPRFAHCHAVVIENLTNYRPDELQTRRENRQLMNWSSSKVKKYLSEACQLHGLHLREVPAGYTSQQDSRTGAPGDRCADVPIHEFMTAPWWRKQVKQAAQKKKDDKDGGTARDCYLLKLDEKYKKVPREQWKDQRPLRIPVKGGELFVSADPGSPAAKGIQADLNAAANIGLKALLDPDWPGRWWYVPCDSATYKPHADKIKGSAAFDRDAPLKTMENIPAADDPKGRGVKATTNTTAAGKKEREIINFWRDPTHSPIYGGSSSWRGSKEYWNHVQSRVVGVLTGKTNLAASMEPQEKSIATTDTPW